MNLIKTLKSGIPFFMIFVFVSKNGLGQFQVSGDLSNYESFESASLPRGGMKPLEA